MVLVASPPSPADASSTTPPPVEPEEPLLEPPVVSGMHAVRSKSERAKRLMRAR
jgi:hypothetical protein